MDEPNINQSFTSLNELEIVLSDRCQMLTSMTQEIRTLTNYGARAVLLLWKSINKLNSLRKRFLVAYAPAINVLVLHRQLGTQVYASLHDYAEVLTA